MSVRSLQVLAGAGLSRREMIGTLARWTVPTVLTITLAARNAYAAPSCPPCTKRTAGRCQACSMNQILNCQCEPCLGAPYCTGGVRAPAARPQGSISGGNLQSQAPGGAGAYGAPGQRDLDPYLRAMRRRQALQNNPFDRSSNPIYRSPFQSTPFGVSRPYGLPFDSLRARPKGLYDRLRPDERRPF